MRLLRGRAATPEADRTATRRLLAAAADGEERLRVWTPHRQAAFGRRDARSDGFEAAKRAAAERDFPPFERDVGGRAVLYDGRVVAVAHAMPATGRADLEARYAAASDRLRSALSALGAAVVAGEPPGAFCPGSHSLRVPDGGKVAGLAQRVRTDAALVAGCVVVDAAGTLGDAYDAVYRALGVDFDPATVGSVAAAGGPSDPDAVVRALEDAFAPAPARIDHIDRIT